MFAIRRQLVFLPTALLAGAALSAALVAARLVPAFHGWLGEGSSGSAVVALALLGAFLGAAALAVRTVITGKNIAAVTSALAAGVLDLLATALSFDPYYQPELQRYSADWSHASWVTLAALLAAATALVLAGAWRWRPRVVAALCLPLLLLLPVLIAFLGIH